MVDMDSAGWVLKAVEALRFSSERDIRKWLDEEGEELSKLELSCALEALLERGKIEIRNDLFRLKRSDKAVVEFDKLFSDTD